MCDKLSDSLSASTGWSNCPVDILILVFHELDGESLLKCLAINEWWRDMVDYYGQHYKRWKDIAKAGMINKGLKFHNKCSSSISWRDLFFNYVLWDHVSDANISWGYFQAKANIQTMHVYKDTLLIGCGERQNNIGGQMFLELRMTNHKIVDIFSKNSSISETTKEENDSSSKSELDRVKEKLLAESPFTRYSIFDDNCLYILDEKNVMRRYLWDEAAGEWVAEVLGRYYGCSRSIMDIHIYDGDVYILVKTGYVMKADRDGRNFENAAMFDLPPQSLIYFIRLFRSPVLKTIETAFLLDIPKYTSGPNVMFHKFSAIVAVPGDKEFKVKQQEGIDQVVIECPNLTCALEHGGILFLGFNDGKVDICKSSKLLSHGYQPEVSINIQDCREGMEVIDNLEIVAIEVYEAKESHYLFVATCFNVYTVSITYPEYVKDSITVIKRR